MVKELAKAQIKPQLRALIKGLSRVVLLIQVPRRPLRLMGVPRMGLPQMELPRLALPQTEVQLTEPPPTEQLLTPWTHPTVLESEHHAQSPMPLPIPALPESTNH